LFEEGGEVLRFRGGDVVSKLEEPTVVLVGGRAAAACGIERFEDRSEEALLFFDDAGSYVVVFEAWHRGRGQRGH
jgi:hypothetical protein